MFSRSRTLFHKAKHFVNDIDQIDFKDHLTAWDLGRDLVKMGSRGITTSGWEFRIFQESSNGGLTVVVCSFFPFSVCMFIKCIFSLRAYKSDINPVSRCSWRNYLWVSYAGHGKIMFLEKEESRIILLRFIFFASSLKSLNRSYRTKHAELRLLSFFLFFFFPG